MTKSPLSSSKRPTPIGTYTFNFAQQPCIGKLPTISIDETSDNLYSFGAREISIDIIDFGVHGMPSPTEIAPRVGPLTSHLVKGSVTFFWLGFE